MPSTPGVRIDAASREVLRSCRHRGRIARTPPPSRARAQWTSPEADEPVPRDRLRRRSQWDGRSRRNGRGSSEARAPEASQSARPSGQRRWSSSRYCRRCSTMTRGDPDGDWVAGSAASCPKLCEALSPRAAQRHVVEGGEVLGRQCCRSLHDRHDSRRGGHAGPPLGIRTHHACSVVHRAPCRASRRREARPGHQDRPDDQHSWEPEHGDQSDGGHPRQSAHQAAADDAGHCGETHLVTNRGRDQAGHDRDEHDYRGGVHHAPPAHGAQQTDDGRHTEAGVPPGSGEGECRRHEGLRRVGAGGRGLAGPRRCAWRRPAFEGCCAHGSGSCSPTRTWRWRSPRS